MAQYRKLGSCNDPWFCLVCSLPRFCDSLLEDAPLNRLNLPHPLCSTTPSRSPPHSPPRPRKALEFWYTNCQSVKNKLVDFRSTISALPANTVVLLTETWLDHGVHDGEIMDVSSHTIFRNDRRSRGGGVPAGTILSTGNSRHYSWSFTFPVDLSSLAASTARPSSAICSLMLPYLK